MHLRLLQLMVLPQVLILVGSLARSGSCWCMTTMMDAHGVAFARVTHLYRILRLDPEAEAPHLLRLRQYRRLLPRIEELARANGYVRLVGPTGNLRRCRSYFELRAQALSRRIAHTAPILDSPLKILQLLAELGGSLPSLVLPVKAAVSPFVLLFDAVADQFKFPLITVIQVLLMLKHFLLFALDELLKAFPVALGPTDPLADFHLLFLILLHLLVGAQVTSWIVKHLH